MTEATAPVSNDETKKEQIVEITIRTPDRWTLLHWEIYDTARQNYSQAKVAPSNFLTRLHGALALIRAGVVHVEGPEQVVSKLKLDDPAALQNVALAIVADVVQAVAFAIEADLSRPTTSSDFL